VFRQVALHLKDPHLLIQTKKQTEALSRSVHELTSGESLSPWLFNKKTMIDLLEAAGFSTTLLHQPHSEYSLSLAYLAQALAPLPTGLKYRSPYSLSVTSLGPLPTSHEPAPRHAIRDG